MSSDLLTYMCSRCTAGEGADDPGGLPAAAAGPADGGEGEGADRRGRGAGGRRQSPLRGPRPGAFGPCIDPNACAMQVELILSSNPAAPCDAVNKRAAARYMWRWLMLARSSVHNDADRTNQLYRRRLHRFVILLRHQLQHRYAPTRTSEPRYLLAQLVSCLLRRLGSSW